MKKLMMIEGMSCGHCVNHVKNALEEIEGVSSVVVDLQGKNALVELSKDVACEILKGAVEEAGYDVVDIKTI
ncbi:copper ion binding protein [Anaerosolibacter carboniphilus]|uniref:Copper ion binding protein n=1 Tax=Anaerosolibacter carboniphilus TaxID=1417629 RepID=A0A841L305_9FIRM|nr:heavy-metal-associated domain-containing protein [Anaerosolibacter carboniphilus]MBB6216769.1 copper ion binding protein [Anaerosolibacter carboniphilus]